MHVRVDEARERMLAGRFDHVPACRGLQRPGLAQLGDPAAADQDVPELIQARAWIEDVCVPDHQVGAGPLGREQLQPLCARHAATAITGLPASSS